MVGLYSSLEELIMNHYMTIRDDLVKTKNLNTIFLTSSGVDSFCMWHLFKDKYPNAEPVYFSLGHKYQDIELKTFEKLAFNVKVVDFMNLGNFEQENAFIPYRNLLLFAGACLLSADQVLLGSLRGEYSLDKSPKFMREASDLLSFIGERKVKLLNPVGKYTKTQLVREFLKAHPGKLQLLKTTHSCYQDEKRCGQCMACFRRWVAFSNNGIEESYLNPPWEWQAIKYNNLADWLKKFWKNPRLDILINNYDAYLALRNRI